MEKEIWKVIDGFDKYEVSNLGNVRSNTIRSNGKLLKQITHRQGYKRVYLYKNLKRKVHYVHRLVAKAFIPNPKNKCEINHKDGVKDNNYYKNLEWCTRIENSVHGVKEGLIKPPDRSKKVQCLRTNKMYKSAELAGKDNDITGDAVTYHCRGQAKEQKFQYV